MKPIFIATAFWTAVGLLHVGLALPPALRLKSWRRFGIALVLSFVGIVLPIFIFSASAFMVPEWKGGCHHGWLDCFHRGKLALLPFVLWASAALYAVEVLRVEDRNRRWIVLGIGLGALVSTVCLIFGTITVGFSRRGEHPWMLVPLYVATWYVIRAVQLARTSRTSWVVYLFSFFSSIPFWIGSVVWSRRCYLALPDQAPDCFVVTAAMQGHAGLVGPFTEVRRNGQQRMANRQLMTFWGLERVWRQRLPLSHRSFRSLYNRLGPMVSRRINSRFTADMVYLLLKPVEFLGWLVLAMESRSQTGANHAVVGTSLRAAPHR